MRRNIAVPDCGLIIEASAALRDRRLFAA